MMHVGRNVGFCFRLACLRDCRYRVFLGHKQYFVSSDVGHGKMQWYAFYNEAAGGTDPPNCESTASGLGRSRLQMMTLQPRSLLSSCPSKNG